VKVITTRFGEQEIEEDKIIVMPEGMAGFGERNFIILNPENGGPFCWFHATDNPDLAFVVVEPSQFVSGYQVRLTREEYDKLLLEEGGEIVILTVVTMAPDPRLITVNLQGPIVINPARMTALQVVLEGNYTTRCLLFNRESAMSENYSARQKVSEMPRLSSLFSGLKPVRACA
jgi:flagellar assembly factor FliW